MDAVTAFKQSQKEAWVHFTPLEALTTPVAARTVRFAGVRASMRVLDVGCGTGVVAITAARLGAQVTGVDLTPQLLERARQNSTTVGVSVDWRDGDVEDLPFADAEFDVVISQFAHMFAPRAEMALSEMLRVLKPGGTIAFSTWPPELLVGMTMAVAARYMPPPPPDVANPGLWGDPAVIRQRLGNTVTEIAFDRDCNFFPALSPEHFRANVERTAGPIVKLVETLAAQEPQKLTAFRNEFDHIVSRYFRDNVVRQDYLLTRAVKV